VQIYQVEVALARQEDGLWRAEVPALPGCFVDSDTIEEAMQDIQEGIQLFIKSYRKRGKGLPPELEAVTPDGSYSLRIAVSVP
jgi:predicted RNase H-like HicB family nuclease